MCELGIGAFSVFGPFVMRHSPLESFTFIISPSALSPICFKYSLSGYNGEGMQNENTQIEKIVYVDTAQIYNLDQTNINPNSNYHIRLSSRACCDIFHL